MHSINSNSITRIAAFFILIGTFSWAYAEPIKIAHVYGKTGPFELYARQSHDGLMLGIEYATNGTFKVRDRKIEVLVKDSQLRPDLGRTLLEEAYADDEVTLAIGGISSSVALALLPIAEEYEKVLFIEPAVADSITGKDGNRYVFRTTRNSSQDAISNALAIGKPGVYVSVLAPDNAYGRDGVAAYKEALERTGAKLVHEEYAPSLTKDFTAHGQRIFDALRRHDGERYIFFFWSGTGNPLGKIHGMNPKRYNIKYSTGGHIFAGLTGYKLFPGLEGATYYYYENPNNPINDWLVKVHQERFKYPPDMFTASGMSAGIAIVEALRRAKTLESDDIIAAAEGMRFNTPKGEMHIRKDDHQAMQSMYHFKIRVDEDVLWAIPDLVREIKPEEMKVPIRAKF
ncbi:MAG: substrate-binding domain-containing protein [Agarilytica sp.]